MPTIFKGRERFDESNVATSICADEFPVVVLPAAPPSSIVFSKIAAFAVASSVNVASVAIMKRCIGLSYTNPVIGKLVFALPEPGQWLEKVFFPVEADTNSHP